MTAPSTARRIADDLLDIGAVSFAPEAPFTWASGLKSPVYCDNRMTISHPAVRRRICDGFVELLLENEVSPDVVVGTATAGIPHAAWLADALDRPMAYVRAEPKAHGRGSQIEGRIEQQSGAIVVEDLVSTGGSSADVVRVVREGGADVEAVLAIFSYELDVSQKTFRELNVPLFTLTGFDALFAAASARSILSDQAIRSIRSWRDDPHGWSDRHS